MNGTFRPTILKRIFIMDDDSYIWYSFRSWYVCIIFVVLLSSEPVGLEINTINTIQYRAQWLRGRTSDSRLREPRFESCAAVLKPWASFFTLHCSSSLSYINEYLAINSGGYVYEQPSRINCSIWLDASQRSQDGV